MPPSFLKDLISSPNRSQAAKIGSASGENRSFLHRLTSSRGVAFKYPPLNDQAPSIRLLRLKGVTREYLLPSAEFVSERPFGPPIVCELTLAYLGDGGQRRPENYDAISYYWGAPSSPDRARTCTITLDGVAFSVSPIVRDVLRYLQTYEDRLIWIDFICIDQDNDVEKASQIARMRDIYAQAEQVIVCLTEVQQMREAAGRLVGLKNINEARLAVRGYHTTVLPLCIIAHPWFDRIWIVQEVFHAREVVINYEGRLAPGRDFANALKDANRNLTLPTLLLRDRYANVEPLLQTMSEGVGQVGLPLIELLHTYRARDSSLGVDKVFALLSMCSDDTSAPELVVDYALSPLEVFRNVALYMIRRTKTLDIMTYRSRQQVVELRSQTKRSTHRKAAHTMPPSWFPLWDDRDTTVASTRSTVNFVRLMDHTYHNRPRPTSNRGNEDKQGEFELLVSGICIGTITSVFADGTVEAIPDSRLPEEIRTIWDWAGISNRLKHISEHLGSPSEPGLLKNDEMWILTGSTGLAILRKAPSSPQKRLLVTLEHSDFPRFGDHEPDRAPWVEFSPLLELKKAAMRSDASSLTKIADLVARVPFTEITLV